MSKKKEVDEFPFITKWGNDLMDKQGQFINMVVDREESINKILPNDSVSVSSPTKKDDVLNHLEELKCSIENIQSACKMMRGKLRWIMKNL